MNIIKKNEKTNILTTPLKKYIYPVVCLSLRSERLP
jgi:hypothetical protein